MAFGFCSAIALIVYVDRKHLAAYLPSHNSVASLVISRSATFLGHSADSFFANAVIERPSGPGWSLAAARAGYLPSAVSFCIAFKMISSSPASVSLSWSS
jgi:hypothetical protein